jgi:hypothetical protein
MMIITGSHRVPAAAEIAGRMTIMIMKIVPEAPVAAR